MNLRSKTLKGISWSGTAQVCKQMSQFVVTVILARLLSPGDFGLIGMAAVFTNFVYSLSELGFGSALIQKQDAKAEHFNSAFWLNIVLGLALMSLLMAAAPMIASFYNMAELKLIVMALSLNFIIASLATIQTSILTKAMEFKKLAIVEFSSILISGIAAVYFAITGHGVWSLVYQQIIFTSVSTILLWLNSDWRPQWMFSIQAIKDMFNFSAQLTGTSIVYYFSRNLDYLLIGKFLGAQALGYYALAYKLMMVPLHSISWVVNSVMFPAFSKIQNDLPKVREVYQKMVKSISLITFPLMFGVFAIADEFIRVFYGPQWEPVILLLKILCFCAMIQSVLTTVGNIFLSQGRADLQLKLSIISTMATLGAVVVGLQWGIIGVAVCYTLKEIFWMIYVERIVNNMIQLRLSHFYANFLTSLIIGIGVFGVITLAKIFINAGLLSTLLGGLLVGGLTYVVLLFLFKELEIRSRKIIVKFI